MNLHEMKAEKFAPAKTSSHLKTTPRKGRTMNRGGGVVILLGVVLIFCTSCVSLSKNKRDINEAYVRGLQKARKIAYQQHCEDAVAIISGRINVEEMKQ